MGVVLLVRHGQASLGTANYDQLSDVGRRQAELTARRLARSDLRIDQVVCGPLIRQHDTALALLAALGRDAADLVTDPRLDEYDHVSVLAMHAGNVSFSSATSPDAKRQVQPALDEAIARWMAAPSGSAATGYAESHEAFIGRVLAAVTELSALAGTTAATTSGGVIAVAAAHLLGLGAQRWPALARVTVNGSITKLITGRAGTNVVTFNDHAHLEEDRSLITYR